MSSNSKLTADPVSEFERSDNLVVMPTAVPVRSGNGTQPAKPHLPEELAERQRGMLKVLSRKAFERTQMLKRSSRELIDTSRKLVSESKRRRQKALGKLEARAA